MNVVVITIGIIGWAALLWILLSLCHAASKADRAIERLEEERKEKDGMKGYHEKWGGPDA
jgi:hypothetical protein